ncbi:hypothetical protein PVAG01_03458 [Phlyctema vagabunda]|uniref:Uncharacterized protein n=1 Tax=Phlyctema vagabunda TaxID=108571 RepID=A0ABR4PM55_9HELO
MDSSQIYPGSPGTPLLQVSPDRANQQRGRNDLPQSPTRGSLNGGRYRENHGRDSSVHEKISAFNSLGASQQDKKMLEQAAQLKRAMLGREEAIRARGEADQQRDFAKSELRKYENECKKLSQQLGMLMKKLDEGKARELIVCQKLETRQEELGQSREKYQHTKAEWEKEVRRLRKEAFKSQSMMVKLQEELKAARLAHKIVSNDFDAEKQRSKTREQEAFEARYQLVGVQEELAQMAEKVKLVEQERDALRMIAKNEEIARIAAEGRLPLPRLPECDEFASPKKARRSLDPVTVLSSAASEEELQELKMLLKWERQNAARAHDRIEFLEAECRLVGTLQKDTEIAHAVPAIELNHETGIPTRPASEAPSDSEDEPRMTHIFIPAEGIFKAVPLPENSLSSPTKKAIDRSPSSEREGGRELHARTPSCEPPSLAIIQDINTRASLQSLFDAPQGPVYPSQPLTNDENIISDESEGTTFNPSEKFGNLTPTFHTISTTTRIPLADPADLDSKTILKPTRPDFDSFNPTMTREEALARIQERRGRARSLAQGTMTPRKQMVEGGGARRDISAPAFRSGKERGRPQVRS